MFFLTQNVSILFMRDTFDICLTTYKLTSIYNSLSTGNFSQIPEISLRQLIIFGTMLTLLKVSFY